MNSNVVKNISKLFHKFACYIKSNEVNMLIKKKPQDFTRVFKFPWYDVLYFLIFRSEKCILSEITKCYRDIGKSELRISKQDAFKAIKKVHPNVFPALIHKLAE